MKKTVFAAALMGLAVNLPAARAQTGYVVGVQDVLAITVYDHADLTGKFQVESDGMFTFPLIGRVAAAGLTVRALEADLTRLLADGYLKRPQVSISVDQYRSQRITVMGEVRSPGAYPYTGDMTLIDALTRAGSPTGAAGSEVLIVRQPHGGPASGEDGDEETIRVDLTELLGGSLARNVQLQPGDLVIVPRMEAVYIAGQVRSPGAYPVERGTTVLQALSLAGGVTERGSTGRIRIIRFVDGKKKEMKAKLDDVVEPGDTIVVPERFF